MTLEIRNIKSTKDKGIESEKKMHEISVSFVNNNSDLFNFYAGKYEVNIKAAPVGLNTFAYNLENSDIYVNDMFFKEEMNKDQRLVANEKSTFAVMHEIEHMLEHKNILKESREDNPLKMKGKDVFDNYLKSLEKDQAFAHMDNCIADIRENKAVIKKTNPLKRNIEKEMYKEDLFPTEDLRFQKDQFGNSLPRPKHIQFNEALLLEDRLGEVIVDNEVREAISKVKEIKDKNTGKNILEIITDPDFPMSHRLFYQNKIIKPIMEVLKKQDYKDKNDNQNKNQNQNEDAGRNQENSKNNKEENQYGKNSEGNYKNNKDKENKKSAANDAIRETFDKLFGKNKKGPKESSSSKDEEIPGGDIEDEPTFEDYNKAFEKDYKMAKDRMLPKSDIDKIKKANKEYLDKNPNLGETDKEKLERLKREAIKKKAKDLGVSVKDLQNYESLSKALRQEKEFQKLNDLIKRIVTERKKERYIPKYPLEEGDEILDPAQLVASVRSGDLKPKVWQDTEIKEYKGDMFGEIEMTFVFDRSGSMEGVKIQEVQKAVTLFMNSQKDLQDEIKEGEESENGLIKGLKISWEVYSFQNTNQDFIPIKKMSDEFTEKDRIEVCAHFNDAPGNRTTDGNSLSAIYNGLKNNTKKIEKLKDNELKKIVMVMTDGDSHQLNEVKDYTKKLKDLKVAVLGIGITNDAKHVLTTYGAGSKIAEKAKDVSVVMEEIIEKEFKDLLPLK